MDGCGGENVGHSGFRQAKRAGTTQAECSHGSRRGSLDPRSPGSPHPKRARMLPKMSQLNDLLFGHLATGEEPEIGG
jgi:hypothetical protein